MILTTPADGYIGWCEAIRHLDVTARLKAISLPACIIVGALDPATPPAAAEVISNEIKGSDLIVMPGVSFTYLKRDLPTTTIAAKSGSNSLTINNLKVNTTAWRVVASKSLLLFSFAVGAGKDSYDQSADIAAQVSGTFSGVPVSGNTSVPGTAQKLERTNLFADVALNLPLFKIVGEVGQVSGGKVATYNGFSGGRADKDQQYFSVGIRIGL